MSVLTTGSVVIRQPVISYFPSFPPKPKERGCELWVSAREMLGAYIVAYVKRIDSWFCTVDIQSLFPFRCLTKCLIVSKLHLEWVDRRWTWVVHPLDRILFLSRTSVNCRLPFPVLVLQTAAVNLYVGELQYLSIPDETMKYKWFTYAKFETNWTSRRKTLLRNHARPSKPFKTLY